MPTSTAATTTRASSPAARPASLIGTVSVELGRIVAGNFMSSASVCATLSIENHCTPMARPGHALRRRVERTAQGRDHIGAGAPVPADAQAHARGAGLYVLRLAGDETIGEDVDREPAGGARGHRHIHRLARLVVGLVERDFQQVRRVGDSTPHRSRRRNSTDVIGPFASPVEISRR